MIRKVCISFFFLFATVLVAAKPEYYVLVDSGSTGSRVHLYAVESQGTMALPYIEELRVDKVSVPLASYSHHPEKAGQALQPILIQYRDWVQHRVSAIQPLPIYIFATAGMRLLTEPTQQQIYHHLQRNLELAGLSVRVARTLTGEEEALFGWLSVNYLMSDLHPKQTDVVFDLGGASFEATSELVHCTPQEEMSLSGQKYCVLPKSYLNLGMEVAQKSFSHPSCMPTGSEPGKQSRFHYERCAQHIAQYLKHFSVTPLPQTYREHYVGISGLYYVLRFFKAEHVAALKSKVRLLCEQNSWDEIKKKYPHEPEQYLKQYCFTGTYLVNLLSGPYGLGLSEHALIEVFEKKSGREASWTLGALLYTLNH